MFKTFRTSYRPVETPGVVAWGSPSSLATLDGRLPLGRDLAAPRERPPLSGGAVRFTRWTWHFPKAAVVGHLDDGRAVQTLSEERIAQRRVIRLGEGMTST